MPSCAELYNVHYRSGGRHNPCPSELRRVTVPDLLDWSAFAHLETLLLPGPPPILEILRSSARHPAGLRPAISFLETS